MTDQQLFYYAEMLRRNRLIPILARDKLVAFITYFICDKDKLKRYTDREPWTILNDQPLTGTICYIDQLISNKDPRNYLYSFTVFRDFVGHISWLYPQVKKVRWHRHKGGKTYVFDTDIRRKRVQKVTL